MLHDILLKFGKVRSPLLVVVLSAFVPQVGAADALDDLFIDPPSVEAPDAAAAAPADGLGDLDKAASGLSGWKGFSQFELARTVSGDSHCATLGTI